MSHTKRIRCDGSVRDNFLFDFVFYGQSRTPVPTIWVLRRRARVILSGAKPQGGWRSRTFSAEIPNDASHRSILVTLGFRRCSV